MQIEGEQGQIIIAYFNSGLMGQYFLGVSGKRRSAL